MKEIQLTQGKVALVDDGDFERLNQFKWFAWKRKYTFYACRNYFTVDGKKRIMLMHQEIIGKRKNFETDHRDGNGLHNFKNNLRHVTTRQNRQNVKNILLSSQYPGVHWCNREKKWVAMIRIDGIKKWLGYFTNEIEAFRAYRQAVEVIGEKVIEGVI